MHAAVPASEGPLQAAVLLWLGAAVMMCSLSRAAGARSPVEKGGNVLEGSDA